MNQHVNAISGRPSALHWKSSIASPKSLPPGKEADTAALLATIQSELVTVTDFEREFAPLCFALVTGLSITRLTPKRSESLPRSLNAMP